MGTTGMVAQARGAGDDAETGALLMRALMIGAAAGILMIAGQLALFRFAFWLAPASRRGRAAGAGVSLHPHLGSARGHRRLCR